jgi:hypothetical protein
LIIRRKREMEEGVEGWLVGMAISRVRTISNGEMIRCVRRWLATEMESPQSGDTLSGGRADTADHTPHAV